MRIRSSSPGQSAWTLIELLVSVTIAVVLMGLLSYAMSSFVKTYVSSTDKSVTDRDAELALDYIIRDMESLVIPSAFVANGESVEVLRISPEPSIANAHWLTVLSMTHDLESGVSGGAVRAVSYRIGFQDPIEGSSGSGDPEYALYRKVLTADDTFDKALESVDPRSEIWGDPSLVPDITPVEDYLSANVIDLRVRFLSNESRLPRNDTDQLAIRADGVYINGTRIQEEITGAEVSITILTREGAVRLRYGFPLQELVNRYGRVYTRQTSNLAQTIF